MVLDVSASTRCPIIIARSIYLSNYSGAGNNYRTPCITILIISMNILSKFSMIVVFYYCTILVFIFIEEGLGGRRGMGGKCWGVSRGEGEEGNIISHPIFRLYLDWWIGDQIFRLYLDWWIGDLDRETTSCYSFKTSQVCSYTSILNWIKSIRPEWGFSFFFFSYLWNIKKQEVNE